VVKESFVAAAAAILKGELVPLVRPIAEAVKV
jgi:hypothetical protein